MPFVKHGANVFVAAHSESTEPARSSMWSGLLSHLKSSLKLKRRRVHFKTHCDCFAGSEAVDVVEEHINTVKAFEGVCERVCFNS